uniref:Small integral membrane protein 22 n=1 Tax=Saimiri boliviensis boliviensis TaxID=39432 RepID=A0A2K6TV34_SAIBB
MAVSMDEVEATVQEVLGKLKSHQLFQSTWDTASFVIFLTFVGTVLLLLLLVVTHCCCCSCCGSPRPHRESLRKVSPWKVSPAGLSVPGDLHRTVLGVEVGDGGGGKGACPPREQGANLLGSSVLLLQERPKGVDNLALEP